MHGEARFHTVETEGKSRSGFSEDEANTIG